MEDSVIKWTAIYITLDLVWYILKSVDSLSTLTNEWELSLKLVYFIQLRVYLEPVQLSDQSMVLKETRTQVNNDGSAL